MAKLFTWRVEPPATGDFRSFHKRGWPSAELKKDARFGVFIHCETEYYPDLVKSGKHATLKVTLDLCRNGVVSRQTLAKRFDTYADVKDYLEEIAKKRPELFTRVTQ